MEVTADGNVDEVSIYSLDIKKQQKEMHVDGIKHSTHSLQRYMQVQMAPVEKV